MFELKSVLQLKDTKSDICFCKYALPTRNLAVMYIKQTYRCINTGQSDISTLKSKDKSFFSFKKSYNLVCVFLFASLQSFNKAGA